MTGSVSQSEDDRRGAEAFQAKYGEENVSLAIYPDNFTEEQETALAGVLGVICDIDLFQFYDTFEPELWMNENGSDAELNYWLHAAKVCGISPFANAVVFVAGEDDAEGFDVEP